MAWLSAIVVEILKKVLAWILSIVAKEYAREQQIKKDEKIAESNAEKVTKSATDEERRRNVEDLLNGRD